MHHNTVLGQIEWKQWGENQCTLYRTHTSFAPWSSCLSLLALQRRNQNCVENRSLHSSHSSAAIALGHWNFETPRSWGKTEYKCGHTCEHTHTHSIVWLLEARPGLSHLLPIDQSDVRPSMQKSEKVAWKSLRVRKITIVLRVQNVKRVNAGICLTFLTSLHYSKSSSILQLFRKKVKGWRRRRRSNDKTTLSEKSFFSLFVSHTSSCLASCKLPRRKKNEHRKSYGKNESASGKSNECYVRNTDGREKKLMYSKKWVVRCHGVVVRCSAPQFLSSLLSHLRVQLWSLGKHSQLSQLYC